jgi:sensor c-di-GMP phosphodiesterase-like protein
LTPLVQADLAAFLAATDQANAAAASPAASSAAGAITRQTWQLLGLGLAGALALMVLLAFFWPRQRQSISARLRQAHKAEQP